MSVEVRQANGLSNMVALFDAKASKHIQSQAVNPFANDSVRGMPKPKISKEEYGRPAKGSLSETRALIASQHVYRELLELCEIINENGEPLFTPEEKANDDRVVIAFGDLFNIYTLISDKLVGMLLRARKYKLVDFEGEVLFQRRDDHVPIILLKSIKDIRNEVNSKIQEAAAAQKANEEQFCSRHESYK